MRTLEETYPAAPPEALRECQDLATKYGLDPVSVQMTLFESESLGRWVPKITRHGYRKLAQQQPGYTAHHYITIYRGDKVAIKGNEILVEIGSETRQYNDLLGAIAWLYDSGQLYFIRISYSDYSRQKHGWDPSQGRPDYMLQKEAETMVIRKAYPHLFWCADAKAAELDDEDAENSSRADKIQYLKDHKNMIKEWPKLPLPQCSNLELEKLVDEIKTALEQKDYINGINTLGGEDDTKSPF